VTCTPFEGGAAVLTDVRAIWAAIRSRQAAAELGEGAAGLLGELLSAPGIVETCF